jgi:putative drug exporter of the RND superfamily
VLDATIVRMVLVPATMALLGRANWWLPSWLDRRLPRRRALEAAVPQAPQPAWAPPTRSATIRSS